MNLQEWRELQAGGEEAVLPSGLTVKLKRVGVLDLARRGEIPQTIQPQIDGFINAASNGAAPQVGLNEFNKFASVIDLVCGACILAPEGLQVEELPHVDRLAIFDWANEVNAQLTTFRKEPGPDVAATQFSVGV